MQKKIYINTKLINILKNNDFIVIQINKQNTKQYIEFKKKLQEHNLPILNIKNKALIAISKKTKLHEFFEKTLTSTTYIIPSIKFAKKKFLDQIGNTHAHIVIAAIINNNILYKSDLIHMVDTHLNTYIQNTKNICEKQQCTIINPLYYTMIENVSTIKTPYLPLIRNLYVLEKKIIKNNSV